MLTDPLADHGEVGRGGVRRDRYGRALLKMRGGDIRVPYTSASSLSDYITNPYAMHKWQMRYLARGLGIREDLAALAGAETYSTGFGEWDTDADNKVSGRRLDDIIARALDTARQHERADYGSAVHLLTEPGAEAAGAAVPARMRGDVDAFWRATRGMTIVATELFVANDELMAAGTFDHLLDGDDFADLPQFKGVEVAGTLLVTDKKTGRLKGPEASVQTAVYAGGELYDAETDERTTFEERFGKPVSQQVAILFWIPAGQQQAIPFPLNLVEGREAALHAVWVRDWQKRALALGQGIDTEEMARERARSYLQVADPSQFEAIWREFEDVWTDDLTALANGRLAQS